MKQYIKDAIDSGLIKTKKPKLVFLSSPYLRCIETACEMISQFDPEDIFENRIFIDDGISEFQGEVFFDYHNIDKVHLRMKSRKDFEASIGYKVKEGFLDTNKHSAHPTFPEIHTSFFERVKSSYWILSDYFLKEMNPEQDKILIIVTHGFLTRAILGLNEHINSKGTEYTCISQLYYEKGTFRKAKVLKSLDFSHLLNMHGKSKL